MEFCHSYPFVTFVVLTVHQTVGRDDGPLWPERQDSHVFRRTGTSPLVRWNFFVESALKTNEQPGTFKCKCSWCKTFPFIQNTNKILRPKRSANVIYHFPNLYLRFHEHLRDVEKNDKDSMLHSLVYRPGHTTHNSSIRSRLKRQLLQSLYSQVNDWLD